MPKRIRRDSAENPYENGDHASDIQKDAFACISLYFKGKSWFCGGPIPSRILLSEDSVKVVLRTSWNDQWEHFVHEKCLPTIPEPIDYDEGVHLPWSVRYLIDLIYSMGKVSIPKEWRPGMVLLYFKFCKGINVPQAVIEHA